MWEDLLEPLEAQEEGAPPGQAVQLKLSERQFRGVVTLLQGAAQMPPQALGGGGDMDG